MLRSTSGTRTPPIHPGDAAKKRSEAVKNSISLHLVAAWPRRSQRAAQRESGALAVILRDAHEIDRGLSVSSPWKQGRNQSIACGVSVLNLPWRELGAIIEAAAWRALVRKATETRSTGKKHLFDSGGKIEVAAHPVKTGHAIGGHVRQCQAGSGSPARFNDGARRSHGGQNNPLSKGAREQKEQNLCFMRGHQKAGASRLVRLKHRQASPLKARGPSSQRYS